MRISDWSSDVCSSDLGRRDDEVLAIDFLLRRGTDDPVLNGAIETGQRDEPVVEIIFRRRIETVGFLRFQIGIALAPIVDQDRDRKSTRLNPVTNAHLVCRLLLDKKKTNKHTPLRKHY